MKAIRERGRCGGDLELLCLANGRRGDGRKEEREKTSKGGGSVIIVVASREGLTRS